MSLGDKFQSEEPNNLKPASKTKLKWNQARQTDRQTDRRCTLAG